MIQTSVGLPNTCSVCGKRVTAKKWWAECEDYARAGSGICDACNTPLAQPNKLQPVEVIPPMANKPQLEPRKPKGKAK